MCVFGYLHCQGYLFHGFHLLEPLPLRQRKGFFFPPKHSHEKFFRKFFQIYPRRLFADFLARICDEGNGCLPLAIGGGTPFFVGLWACRCLSFVPFFAPAMQAAPALFLVAFPLSLWASGPDRLTASGALRHHRGGWSCCVPCFVGWCVASLPRSCSDSLGSIRTTGNRGKGAAVPSFPSVLIG